MVTVRFEHKQRNALCTMSVEGTRVVIHYGRIDGEWTKRTSEHRTATEAASHVSERARHLLARGYLADPPIQRRTVSHPQPTPPRPPSAAKAWSASEPEAAPARSDSVSWLVFGAIATALVGWLMRNC